MGERQVKLFFDKETKRMVRYKAEDEEFGTIYISKNTFDGGDIPEELTMTIGW